MIVRWIPPKDNGGCPITGYALYRDNGVSETTNIEVNSVNDPLVRNIPTLRQLEVQLSNADLGKRIKYELRVFNREGSVAS